MKLPTPPTLTESKPLTVLPKPARFPEFVPLTILL